MTFAEKLRELAGKATPGPWDPDIRLPRRLEEVHMVMMGADGKILFDTLNSEVAEIAYEPDEDGGRYRDVVGKKNLAFIAYLANHASAIAALIEKGEKLKTHLEQGWDESDDPKDIAAADSACDKFIAALSALNRTGGDDERG